jgi:hypothetical protein
MAKALDQHWYPMPEMGGNIISVTATVGTKKGVVGLVLRKIMC